MARTPDEHQTPEYIATDDDTPRLPALVEKANKAAGADALILQSVDLLKMLGRIEMAAFVETVSTKVLAETYLKIKESKAYKGFPYKNSSGEIGNISTLDEFCDVYMPHTRRRCEQLASNYHLLGPELYEQSERLGLRQRDYNAIKALPADEQAIVKQAIEAESRDRVVEILEEIVARNASEKASLKKRADELKASLDASGERNSRLNKRVGDMEEEIANLKGARNADPELAERKLIDDLHHTTLAIVASVGAGLRAHLVRLMNYCDENPKAGREHIRLVLAQALGQVITATRDLAADLDLDVAEQPRQAINRGYEDIWAKVNQDLAAEEEV